MKKTILTLITLILLSISLATATIQYQENANATYSNGNWNGVETRLYDGDYSTSVDSQVPDYCVYQFNYSKPTNAQKTTSNLQIKFTAGTYNLSMNNISDGCWDNNPLQFILEASLSKNNLSCYNGSAYEKFFNLSSSNVYEEGIYWDITTPPTPPTPQFTYDENDIVPATSDVIVKGIRGFWGIALLIGVLLAIALIYALYKGLTKKS